MAERWERIHWTEDGDVHTRRQVDAFCNLPTTAERIAMLRRVLEAVWADAYTHGWSDGKAGRDPEDRANPYSTSNGGRE